jgi:hypothetical protein
VKSVKWLLCGTSKTKNFKAFIGLGGVLIGTFLNRRIKQMATSYEFDIKIESHILHSYQVKIFNSNKLQLKALIWEACMYNIYMHITDA